MTELKEKFPEAIRETFGARQEDVDEVFIATLIDEKMKAGELSDLPFSRDNEPKNLADYFLDIVDESRFKRDSIAVDIVTEQEYFRYFSEHEGLQGTAWDAKIDRDSIRGDEGSGQLDVAVYAVEKGQDGKMIERQYTLYASPGAVGRYRDEIKPKLEKLLKLKQETETAYDEEERHCFERVEALIKEGGEKTRFTYEEWKEYLTILPPGSTNSWSARAVQDGIEIASFDESGHFIYTSLLPKP